MVSLYDWPSSDTRSPNVCPAGMQMEKVYGSKTSVSIGSFTNDYKLLLEKDPQTSAKYLATGTEAGMLANRLSWFFNFGAPSLQIDTACSSSLNALHLACQGLRDHDADMVRPCLRLRIPAKVR